MDRIEIRLGDGTMGRIFYFAYSQHMDPIYLRRLQIPVQHQSPAFLPNYRLEFNVLEDELFPFETRGLANIVPFSGSRVEGVVYQVEEDDFIALDEDAGVPDMKYYRKQVRVYTWTDVRVDAMTYAGWPDVTARGLLPSGKYLRELLRGAHRVGASPEFRHWLETHPTAV